eukprot:3605449-Rhodomonas_salina.2
MNMVHLSGRMSVPDIAYRAHRMLPGDRECYVHVQTPYAPPWLPPGRGIADVSIGYSVAKA